MRVASLLLGLFFCLGVILDAFQTIILPRRPTGRFRITRLFYLATWRPWVAGASLTANRKVREQIYSIYGPMSLLLLLGLWAVLLVSGFGLIYFRPGNAVQRCTEWASVTARQFTNRSLRKRNDPVHAWIGRCRAAEPPGAGDHGT